MNGNGGRSVGGGGGDGALLLLAVERKLLLVGRSGVGVLEEIAEVDLKEKENRKTTKKCTLLKKRVV